MSKQEKKSMGYAARTGEPWGSVALPKSLIYRLKELAKQEGISVSFYLRKMVERNIEGMK